MAYEINDNSGSIFKNREKEKDNPEHAKWADFKGEAKINGILYWVSGWTKTPEGKLPYLSLAFKAKQPKPATTKMAVTHDDPRTVRKTIELDDEVPF
jgi:hypothetical protein